MVNIDKGPEGIHLSSDKKDRSLDSDHVENQPKGVKMEGGSLGIDVYREKLYLLKFNFMLHLIIDIPEVSCFTKKLNKMFVDGLGNSDRVVYSEDNIIKIAGEALKETEMRHDIKRKERLYFVIFTGFIRALKSLVGTDNYGKSLTESIEYRYTEVIGKNYHFTCESRDMKYDEIKKLVKGRLSPQEKVMNILKKPH